MMRRFHLVRYDDPSGVSGTGIVAEGVQYGDGWISMQWIDSPARVPTLFPSVDNMLLVHGHGGKTVHRWLDPQHQAFVTPYRHPVASTIADMDRACHPEDYGTPDAPVTGD